MQKNVMFLLLSACLFSKGNMSEIQIVEMQHDNLQEAKNIIYDAVHELQIIPCATPREAENICAKTNELQDLDDLQRVYFDNKGTMLAILDENKLVGMGGIKRLNDTICELRRMFFAKEYRGKGLGQQMVKVLVDKAKEFGYKKIRLDVYNPATQTRAVNLYTKMGFYEIPPNKNGKAGLVMEKNL